MPSQLLIDCKTIRSALALSYYEDEKIEAKEQESTRAS
jgi:hypothetical protein